MKRSIKKDEIVEYMLTDYQFLQDYEVIDSLDSNKNSFVACIRNSEQKVRFIKKKFCQQQLPRFKALHKLYKNGIVLCDNLFILQQTDQLYFYVIEAEIETKNPRFQTLQHYLYHNQVSQQERKNLLSKIKILIDCVHQQAQSYAGLDTRKIIIDDQKHVYLAPYDLQSQLKTDHFSRAYYSPELLLKISKLQTEISEQLMEKWDIWAYGCIALQLLSFSCPYFMSTSLPRQLKSIEKFSVQNHLNFEQQAIFHLLTNSLCTDEKQRSLSASLQQTKSAKLETLVNEFKQTISNIQDVEQIKCKTKNGTILKQLNIYPTNSSSEKDFQLTFVILSLNNISFQRELQISIHLNRVYHIYLDFDEKSPNKYQINKKITIKAPFQYFQNLLQDLIKVQLKEEQKTSVILVNLKALVLTKQNERVWNQPLMGSYSPSPAKGDSFSRARLKISCGLIDCQLEQQRTISKVPSTRFQNISFNNTFKASSLKNILKEQNYEPNQQADLSTVKDSVQKATTTNKANRLPFKSDKIPSISEIAEQISFITQNFKRKLNTGQPLKQTEVQKRITSLLKIQPASQ